MKEVKSEKESTVDHVIHLSKKEEEKEIKELEPENKTINNALQSSIVPNDA